MALKKIRGETELRTGTRGGNRSLLITWTLARGGKGKSSENGRREDREKRRPFSRVSNAKNSLKNRAYTHSAGGEQRSSS